MYRICPTYTLHVHHELREYLHCSSKTNLMLDLFSRGNLLLQTLEGQADKGKTRASLSSRRQLPLKSSND